MTSRRPRPFILVHGGAGSRPLTPGQRAGLARALRDGYARLAAGGAALSAVESAILVMEASGLFNAGLGARVQLDGIRRLDAALMEGKRLRAGAVAGIEGVKHPIAAARLVLTRTPHVLLAGLPATRLARHFDLARQPRRAAGGSRRVGGRSGRARALRLFRELARGRGIRRPGSGCGTVGAVALDRHGTIAAGVSTGGIGTMLPGRVGDSPLIGAGLYADNGSGGIAMTGTGESIIRIAAGKEIADRLAAGQRPGEAARAVLRKLVNRTGGRAGALVLARDGRFAIHHVTPRMAAGYWDGRGEPVVGDRFR